MALLHEFEPGNSNMTAEVWVYLLTMGASKSIWTMTTVSSQEMIELMPIFDCEEQALSLLQSLQDKTYQAVKVTLAKLPDLIKDRNLRFILNPKTQLQGGQMYFKEGPNWKLALSQLHSLLLANHKPDFHNLGE